METKVTAIVGLNASGKTQLAEQMRRQMATGSLRYVAFCDSYGPAAGARYYLQQRWNQADIEAETPHVGQVLERTFLENGADTPQRRDFQRHLYQLLGLDALLDKYVILLSSGELRKMQLAKALLPQPATLILDNPFIGLDAEARTLLTDLLLRLRHEGMHLYLLLARASEIPPFADEIVRTTGEAEFNATPTGSGSLQLPAAPTDGSEGDEVIRLTDVSIRYGERTILDRLSWTVREGERWALTGRNGSGKSTLLSLVCADNPQSYACDIRLFGHQRGTGESIWDIKRHIGYVSPELNRSYQRPLPTIHIVASGLKDTVGLYVHPTAAERDRCMEWMEVFGVGHLAERPFTQLSSGEQRMALQARAFVKSPRLLVLDEPMHGLDLHRQQLVKDIIGQYCQRPHTTLVMVSHYEEEFPPCIDHRLQL